MVCSVTKRKIFSPHFAEWSPINEIGFTI